MMILAHADVGTGHKLFPPPVNSMQRLRKPSYPRRKYLRLVTYASPSGLCASFCARGRGVYPGKFRRGREGVAKNRVRIKAGGSSGPACLTTSPDRVRASMDRAADLIAIDTSFEKRCVTRLPPAYGAAVSCALPRVEERARI